LYPSSESPSLSIPSNPDTTSGLFGAASRNRQRPAEMQCTC
jgi:hypothetical protein